MAFTNPQWKRHKASIDHADGLSGKPLRMICERCHLVLIPSVMQGQIVLTKEDRMFLGDDPRAEDCP